MERHMAQNIQTQTLSSLKAATTIIRLNNNINTLKSIYDSFGIEVNELVIASTVAITRTIYFYSKAIIYRF